MSVVATLAIAADPYLAAAEAHARSCGYYGPERNLTAGQAASLIARRAEEPAFVAAVDAAVAAERLRTEQARVALRHAVRRAEELQRRITGAVEVIDRATGVGPGHGAAVLGNVRLTLTSSRDDEHTLRREAMLSGRHPAGRALRPTLNDFADQP